MPGTIEKAGKMFEKAEIWGRNSLSFKPSVASDAGFDPARGSQQQDNNLNFGRMESSRPE
jgi:hypothetical protein